MENESGWSPQSESNYDLILYPSGHAGIVLYRDRIAKDSMEFIEFIKEIKL